MYLDLELHPIGAGNRTLVFQWEPESGDVRGRDADRVLAIAAQAVLDELVTGLPYPTPHAIRDPLHSLAEMAVILGNDWRLPPVLAEAYPVVTDDTPPDAVA